MTVYINDDEKHSFENEASITNKNGAQIRFPAWPEDISYVRVTSADGQEIAYWIIDEIIEDPALVLGAIFGAAIGGRTL